MEKYGAIETNSLHDHQAYNARMRDEGVFMSLGEMAEKGGKVTRVRRLSERGRIDTSYVHGALPDGTPVHVNVCIENSIPARGYKAALIEWAKSEGVFAKGVGLLDEGNWSTLYA